MLSRVPSPLTRPHRSSTSTYATKDERRGPHKGLKEALGEAFEEWEVTVVGAVALFEARRPRVVKD